ncbi:MAG: response regulator [Bacteroidota bacterium]
MSPVQKNIIKKLIIADDDHDDQILLKEALEDFENPPATQMVSDGCQLIKVLENSPLPSLVLMDLNMPNKNGIECLLEIRSNTKFDRLPIIVLSTSKDPHDIEACYNSGANLFFSKPYTFKELKTLVHSVLNVDWQSFVGHRLNRQEFIGIALKGQFPSHLLVTA